VFTLFGLVPVLSISASLGKRKAVVKMSRLRVYTPLEVAEMFEKEDEEDWLFDDVVESSKDSDVEGEGGASTEVRSRGTTGMSTCCVSSNL